MAARWRGGQARQHVEQFVGLEGDAGVVGVAGVLGAGPGPLQPAPAVPRAAGVDDGTPQVGQGVVEPVEAPVDPDEDVVDEVTGHVLGEGQQEAEPDQGLVMGPVEIVEVTPPRRAEGAGPVLPRTRSSHGTPDVRAERSGPGLPHPQAGHIGVHVSTTPGSGVSLHLGAGFPGLGPRDGARRVEEPDGWRSPTGGGARRWRSPALVREPGRRRGGQPSVKLSLSCSQNDRSDASLPSAFTL